MKSIFSIDDNGVHKVNTGIPFFDIGVIGRIPNDINYSMDIEDIRSEEKNLIKKITKIKKNNIIFLNQVHEDKILKVDSYPETNHNTFGDADGIITGLSDICLIIRTADCAPIFAYDPENKIIGAVHSGWRGAKLSIASKLIQMIKREYNSNQKNIKVFILPSIGPESYEVNEDVAGFFKNDRIIKGSSIFINLWSNIENSLTEKGVNRENIFNSGICTLKNKKEFFSHRNKDAGRNLNFCLLRSC